LRDRAEAYTIAILFAEALGEEGFRERVKIHATDIDDDALGYARHAAYTAKEIADVPAELRERYFVQENQHYSFRADVGRSVIFGRNDLLQDPPISRVDLLVSRNTLMYLGQEAQDRILRNYFFALQPRGYLMLGMAEALHMRTNLFEPLDLSRRVFVKNHALYVQPTVVRSPAIDVRPAEDVGVFLRETAFEHASLAQVVVDVGGRVSAINHAARSMFQLKLTDVGRSFEDLEVSYRPTDLRSLIDQAHLERRPVLKKDVTWQHPGGGERHLDIQAAPLVSQTGLQSGVVVSFADMTHYRDLHDELERARRDLTTAYELETTNEELQSTNEELETTNEELQSTNEELETMNEELESTNEELEAMNDEMRVRTDEAIAANSFLSSILSSIHQSVIVVDRGLRVRAWSRAAAEAWGLREDEAVGEHLLNLDIGIPAGELRGPIRKVLAGEPQEDVVLTGHDRRGHPIRFRVSFAQLLGPRDVVQGAILAMALERVAAEDAR
jgi:two-component system, chemotaxis family, CheB/CheR fusion protein